MRSRTWITLLVFWIAIGVLVHTRRAVAAEFTIEIERNMTCGDQSTIGRLLVEGREIGRTLELPWRNNEPASSRVPPGRYPAKIRSDGDKRWRIELRDVPDRQHVQVHVGNYQRQIEGCILVGEDVTRSGKVCMVPHSRATLDRLAEAMAQHAADLGGNQSVPIEIVVVVR